MRSNQGQAASAVPPLLAPRPLVLAPSLHLAIDFGFANPFVCLWIRATGVGERAIVHVIDEYVQQGQPMDVHLAEIAAREHGPVTWVACDPAGNGRNDQTAASNVTLLRRAGYRVRFRASRIVDGVEMIRAALRPAAADPNVGNDGIIGRSISGARLFVHPRCIRLIAALRGYRYSETGSELPLKDGEHDHLIDALRYFFVNNTENRVIVSKY